MGTHAYLIGRAFFRDWEAGGEYQQDIGRLEQKDTFPVIRFARAILRFKGG